MAPRPLILGLLLIFVMFELTEGASTAVTDDSSTTTTTTTTDTTTTPTTTTDTTTTTTTSPTTAAATTQPSATLATQPSPVTGDLPSANGLPATAEIDSAQTTQIMIHTFTVSDPDAVYVRPTILNNSPLIFQLRETPTVGTWEVWYLGNYTIYGGQTYPLDIQLDGFDGHVSVKKLFVDVIPNDPPKFSNCTDGYPKSTTLNALATPSGSLVDTIIATDKDGVFVSMNCTPETSPFAYDQTSGRVTTTDDLRHAPSEPYYCDVRANDAKVGHKDQICKLIISITNVNKPPVFDQPSADVSFSEDVPSGTLLWTFTVKDPENETVSLDCTYSPYSAVSLLSLDTTTKQLKLKDGKMFDYEGGPRVMTVTCTAKDPWGLSSIFNLTINVLDGSDPPVFTSKVIRVDMLEESTSNAANLSSKVVDSDAGDTKTFSIVPGPDSDAFTMDPKTGALTHTVDFDATKTVSKVYNLTVLVTDSMGMTDNATIVVTVKDANDNQPLFTSSEYPSTTKLSKSPPSSTPIAIVAATDDDSTTNAQIVYSITPGFCSDYFSINPSNGTIRQVKTIDFAYGTPCTLRLNCTDKGVPPLACYPSQVSLEWEDPPTIQNLPNMATINEGVTSRTCIFDVKVNDTDSFQCARNGTTPKMFTVEHTAGASTAQVCYVGPDPLERPNLTYPFTVTCTDLSGAQTSGQLTINVIPNKAPVCDSSGFKVVTLDASTVPQGATVVTSVATDPENDKLLCNPITWDITSTPFVCDQNTCKCTSKIDLRYENNPEYVATVTVKDARNTVQCKVDFKITNLNVPPQVLNLVKQYSTKENVAAGTNLFCFNLKDNVVCPAGLSCNTLVTPEDTTDRFDTVLSGTQVCVKLLGQLNKEEQDVDDSYLDHFDFSFTCTDGCKTMSPVTTTLLVTNVNEPPVIRGGDSFAATFYETQIGQPMNLNCDAFDVDRGDTLKLTLTPGTNATAAMASMFAISQDPKSCAISLKSEYDLDQGSPLRGKTDFVLNLVATDAAGLTVSRPVNIKILKENDNYPSCEKQGYSSTIYYGTRPPYTIQTIKTNDTDDGVDGQTSCSMSSSDGGLSYADMTSDCRVIMHHSMDGEVTDGTIFHYDMKVCDGSVTNQKCGFCKLTVQYILSTPPPPQPPNTAAPATNAPAATTTQKGASTTSTTSTTTTTKAPAVAQNDIWSNPGIIAMLAVLGVAGLGLLGLLGYVLSRASCKSCVAAKPPPSLESYKPMQKPGKITQVKPAEKPKEPPKEKPKKEPKPKPAKEKKEKKPESPKEKPGTPPNQVHPATPSSITFHEPEPESHHMFEFRKERFDDFDYAISPIRDSVPGV